MLLANSIENLMAVKMIYHIDDNIYCHRSKSEPGYRTLDRDFHIYGYVVPAGFRWNGASAPKLMQWLVPRFDHSLMSSCLHDYLCGIAKNSAERLLADRLYKRALIDVEDFSEERAHWAYRGVRAGAFWGTGVEYPHAIKDKVWPVLGIQ